MQTVVSLSVSPDPRGSSSGRPHRVDLVAAIHKALSGHLERAARVRGNAVYELTRSHDPDVFTKIRRAT